MTLKWDLGSHTDYLNFVIVLTGALLSRIKLLLGCKGPALMSPCNPILGVFNMAGACQTVVPQLEKQSLIY